MEIFKGDPNWIVKEIDLASTAILHRLAVITLRIYTEDCHETF